MVARPSWSSHDASAVEDHFVRLHGATWDDYERVLAIRGDHSGPRVAFLEGELEIMSPSYVHEGVKGEIGCLVEAWCLERGVDFTTYGSWTLKNKRKRRGAEPDECYLFGEAAAKKPPRHPDLAIEVVWTSGGIDKLEIYRKLGVREVWFWEKGRIQPFALRGEQYEAIRASQVLAGIDLKKLATFLGRPTTSQAIRAYVASLRRASR